MNVFAINDMSSGLVDGVLLDICNTVLDGSAVQHYGFIENFSNLDNYGLSSKQWLTSYYETLNYLTTDASNIHVLKIFNDVSLNTKLKYLPVTKQASLYNNLEWKKYFVAFNYLVGSDICGGLELYNGCKYSYHYNSDSTDLSGTVGNIANLIVDTAKTKFTIGNTTFQVPPYLGDASKNKYIQDNPLDLCCNITHHITIDENGDLSYN